MKDRHSEFPSSLMIHKWVEKLTLLTMLEFYEVLGSEETVPMVCLRFNLGLDKCSVIHVGKPNHETEYAWNMPDHYALTSTTVYCPPSTTVTNEATVN